MNSTLLLPRSESPVFTALHIISKGLNLLQYMGCNVNIQKK